MLLENTGENLAGDEIQASVDAELPGLLITPTPSARLDAGLYADQEWRQGRETKLRQALRIAHGLDTAARTSCVLAGLCSVTSGVSWVVSSVLRDLAGYVVAGLALLGMAGLLTTGGLLAIAAAGARRHLLKGAQRDVVTVPAEATHVYQPTDPNQSMAEQEWVRRSNQVQSELAESYRDERGAQNVCLWAGYAWVVSWILLQFVVVLGIQAYEIGAFFAMFGALAWFLIAGLLGVSALVSTHWGSRRKRLLRTAAREGLVVQDPARCPWD